MTRLPFCLSFAAAVSLCLASGCHRSVDRDNVKGPVALPCQLDQRTQSALPDMMRTRALGGVDRITYPLPVPRITPSPLVLLFPHPSCWEECMHDDGCSDATVVTPLLPPLPWVVVVVGLGTGVQCTWCSITATQPLNHQRRGGRGEQLRSSALPLSGFHPKFHSRSTPPLPLPVASFPALINPCLPPHHGPHIPPARY